MGRLREPPRHFSRLRVESGGAAAAAAVVQREAALLTLRDEVRKRATTSRSVASGGKEKKLTKHRGLRATAMATKDERARARCSPL